MKKFFLYLFCCLLLPCPADPWQDQVDTFLETDNWQAAINLLEEQLTSQTSGSAQCEIYWRMARVTMDRGLTTEKTGATKTELLGTFQAGTAYADQAIAADPHNHLGYYWKAANLGKWSQLKGLFDAFAQVGTLKELLFQALACKPDHADSYYVLAQLYAQLPGFPISYGSIDYAVSQGRYAVWLMEQQLAAGDVGYKNYDFYLELAKHLHKRNWNAKKRSANQAKKKKQASAASHPVEQRFFFEGTIELQNCSDREEARQLVYSVIQELAALPDLTSGQAESREKAADLLAKW